HAINLDGGGSTGLGYQGSFPVAPQRGLSNFILVYENDKNRKVPDYPDVRQLLAGRDKMKAQVYEKRAEKFINHGQIGAALNYYKKACIALPWKAELFARTAELLKSTNRIELAAKYYGKASLKALEAGDVDQTKNWSTEALRLNTNSNYAREALDLLTKFPEFAIIGKLLANKEFKKAKEKIEILIEFDKQNPYLHLTYGRVLDKLDLPEDKARAFYNASLGFRKKEDKDFEYYLMAKKAVETDPNNPVYRKLLINASKSRGDYASWKYHSFISNFLNQDKQLGKK
ncbi:MAG: hypothetical protein ACLFQV_14125, partial [Vulcanimicrobiota bacterium]